MIIPHKLKNIALIPVRLGSRRLPRKALLEISGKPCLQILIERIKTVKNLDDIIVCTTKNKSDDELIEFLNKIKIKSFRGDEKDILLRFKKSIETYDVENIVIIDGDDIFCEPNFISKTIDELEHNECDCIQWINLPFGVTPFGFKKNALLKICSLKKTNNTETGWIRFFTNLDSLKIKQISSEEPELCQPKIRLTLDYPEDLDLLKKLFKKLPENFTLKNIVELFSASDNEFKINNKLNKKYWKNFYQNTQT